MQSLPILPSSLTPIPKFSNQSISSCRTFNGRSDLFLLFSTPSSSFTSPSTIRMGGGPRTFPGGVTKWQWKRMQAKKSKQLLKARLCRERQLYDMRKRAELKAAISELERPWEVAERAPVLFSISVDEQIKALADRFQRPSGFDMWSEKDGPRLFPKDAGSNQESYCSDSELVVAGSREADEEIDGHFDSDLAVYGSKMNGDDKLARGLDSRFERHKRHSDSYGFQSELAVNGSNMKRDKLALAGSRMQRQDAGNSLKPYGVVTGNLLHGSNQESYYCSDSELVVAGSRKAEEEQIDRQGGSHKWDSDHWGLDSRFERQKSHSYGSQSELAVNGSNMKRDKLVRMQRSHSELKEEDNEGEISNRSGYRNASAGGYDRRSKNQGSNRSYSELALADSHSRYRNASASGYDRRSENRGSNRSHSELALTDSHSRYRNSYGSESEIENAAFARRSGGVRNQRSSESYSRMQRQEMSSSFDRRRGRGGTGLNRNSYCWESEIENAGFRRGRNQNTDRDYSDEGRVLLRPTTELRNNGFRSGRSGTRRSY